MAPQVQAFLKRRLAETFRIRGARDLAITFLILCAVVVALLWLAYGREGDEGGTTVRCTYDTTSANCTRY